MRFVCNRSSRPGSKFSVMRSWLERTATPLHTHREQSTSRTWRSRSEAKEGKGTRGVGYGGPGWESQKARMVFTTGHGDFA